jgi:hypothetical protein
VINIQDLYDVQQRLNTTIQVLEALFPHEAMTAQQPGPHPDVTVSPVEQWPLVYSAPETDAELSHQEINDALDQIGALDVEVE